MTTNNYIFNLETTKIELHFEKSDYAALSDEQKKEIKSAFLWSNKGKCWVSRAKEPNLWRAKQVAGKLGFIEEQREGERLSFGEQMERQTERAEARADRYEGYANNAVKRAEQLQNPLNSLHGDIAFFTQPNINSSSGRAFTNYRNRLYERYNKGFEEYRKSEYFKDCAQTSRETASNAQLNDLGYLDRRIKECKKTIRQREKNIIYYEEILFAVENGVKKTWHGGEIVTEESVKTLIARELELIEKAMDKQGYLENCVDALGGIRFSSENIKVGYIIRIKHTERAEVISVGPVNVGYKILTGGAAGMTLTATYAEILEILESAEKIKGKHPFVVGEQYAAKIWDSSGGYGNGKFVNVIYEIVKATASTIQLQQIGSDEKPITRKPSQRYNRDWCFSIDDTHGNTYCKEEGTILCT